MSKGTVHPLASRHPPLFLCLTLSVSSSRSSFSFVFSCVCSLSIEYRAREFEHSRGGSLSTMPVVVLCLCRLLHPYLLEFMNFNHPLAPYRPSLTPTIIPAFSTTITAFSTAQAQIECYAAHNPLHLNPGPNTNYSDPTPTPRTGVWSPGGIASPRSPSPARAGSPGRGGSPSPARQPHDSTTAPAGQRALERSPPRGSPPLDLAWMQACLPGKSSEKLERWLAVLADNEFENVEELVLLDELGWNSLPLPIAVKSMLRRAARHGGTSERRAMDKRNGGCGENFAGIRPSSPTRRMLDRRF